MNILILLDGLSIGGSQTKSVRLANELAERGQSVYLAYLYDATALLDQIDNAIPTACLERQGKFSFRALKNLSALISRHDITVVLCMNLYPLLYAGLVKLVLRKHYVKVVSAINTTDFIRRRDRWFMVIYSFLIRRIDGIIFGCDNQRKLWQKRYRIGSTPAMVIYNGVNCNRFESKQVGRELRAELGLGERFVVGCVGRLDPEKNHQALIRAISILRDGNRILSLIIVGTGPERRSIEDLAVALGVRSDVHFVGQLEDVRPALAAMDVFVLPSVAVETFSNAALEAMSMSLPVVLSNIGGAAEMISDGDNGFLFDKNDTGALSTILAQLQSDPGLRARIGAAARSVVVSRFSFSRMVDDYIAVLNKLGG